MTAKKEKNAPRSQAIPRVSLGMSIFLLMASLSFFLILLRAEEAVLGMKRSLVLCAQTVIPSLFPFMAISELIVRSGAASILGRLLSPLFRGLFGIKGAGGTALLLGCACGFPIGAKSAVGLYDAGEISRGELCHLLCFCNQPSSAFVTSVVGISLFGSYRFGLLLYAITLLSGLAVGIGCRFLLKKDDFVPAKKESQAEPSSGVARFTDAVSRSARGMLTVCAFVCFFGTLVACLETLPALSHVPHTLSTLLVGFFELTGGVARAATCTPPSLAAYAAAWCLGWSGLSVHFQVLSLCERTGLSFRPYFAAKAAQSALNVALLALVLHAWPRLAPKGDIPSVSLHAPHRAWTIWLCLLLLALIVCVAQWGKKHAVGQKIRQKMRKKRAK